MANIVGIRYKQAGKIYYFDPMDIELVVGDRVVVETSRGLEIGHVVMAPTDVADAEINQPLKPVVRLATEEDVEQAKELDEKEKEALAECGQVVQKLGLQMKLISAEYTIDASRLVIFFSAEGRVDFRELVRELGRRLRTRVEMRQVGPRDEAKMIGGFGRCGRGLCCANFLSEFEPVSIKMAKAQNLPLNPAKISGVCGRLLCCLDYEFDVYKEQKAKMPRNGQLVSTPMGKAIVTGGSPLEEMVQLELEGGGRAMLPLDKISIAEGDAPSKTNGNSNGGRPPRRRRRS